MSLRSETPEDESTAIDKKLTADQQILEETNAAGGGGEDADSGGYCTPGYFWQCQMKTPVDKKQNRALMMMSTPSFCRYFESAGSCSPSPSPSPSMESAVSCSHSQSTDSSGSFFSPIVDLEFLRAGRREHDLHRPVGENSAATATTPSTAESFSYKM